MTFSSEQTSAINKGAEGILPSAMNVGNIERTASILAGGVALLLLSRRLFVYVGLALMSAYLVYRGVTGRCALYSRAHINTRGMDDLSAGTGAGIAGAGSGATSFVDGISADGISADDAGESEDREIEKWMERERAEDLVEQSSWESFPASDPPGGGVA